MLFDEPVLTFCWKMKKLDFRNLKINLNEIAETVRPLTGKKMFYQLKMNLHCGTRQHAARNIFSIMQKLNETLIILQEILQTFTFLFLEIIFPFHFW